MEIADMADYPRELSPSQMAGDYNLNPPEDEEYSHPHGEEILKLVEYFYNNELQFASTELDDAHCDGDVEECISVVERFYGEVEALHNAVKKLNKY